MSMSGPYRPENKPSPYGRHNRRWSWVGACVVRSHLSAGTSSTTSELRRPGISQGMAPCSSPAVSPPGACAGSRSGVWTATSLAMVAFGAATWDGLGLLSIWLDSTSNGAMRSSLRSCLMLSPYALALYVPYTESLYLCSLLCLRSPVGSQEPVVARRRAAVAASLTRSQGVLLLLPLSVAIWNDLEGTVTSRAGLAPIGGFAGRVFALVSAPLTLVVVVALSPYVPGRLAPAGRG